MLYKSIHPTSIYYYFYNLIADIYYKFKYRDDEKNHKKRNRQLFSRYCREITKYLPEAIFVKVGANDGITNDPCSNILIADTKWKGILIEPQQYFIDILKENFNDADRFVIEQAAISSAPGKKKFYYFDHEINKNQNDIKAWYFMVASFDKGHLKKHFDKSLWPFIKDCIVETDTLSNILGKNNIYEFQLLHIDTEGHDLKVLQSMDFSVYMPALIYIEYKHLSDSDNLELLNLLENQGYTVYDCGIDYFAVHKKRYMRYL